MDYISHSRILTYMDCPQKYKHRYVNGWKQSPEAEHFVLGSMVHDGVKRLAIGEPLDAVIENLHTYNLADYKDPQAIKAQASRIIKVIQPKLSEGTQLMVEQEFRSEIMPGIVMLGIVDYYQKTDDDKLRVVDWKTSGSEYADYIKYLSGQLTMYQILLENNGHSVDLLAFAVVVKGGYPVVKMLEVGKRTPAEVTEYLDKVKWVYENIQAGKFPKNEGYHCKFCEYLPLCLNKEPVGLVQDMKYEIPDEF